MRQMALPRAESGAKSRGSTSSKVTPSSLARAASSRGVRSVRVVPGWMQLTVTPKRPSCTARVLVRCTSEVLRAPPLRLPALRALVPLMLMMRPQRCSFMCGMTARAQRSAPTYLTLKSCSRSSSTTVSMGPVAVAEPPGGEPLLTRMCTPPSCAAACATIPSTCARLVTSATTGMMRRPVATLISCAAASSGPFVRAAMATFTPSRASSSAMALPMPRLPPVSIAFLPASPRSIVCLPLWWSLHAEQRLEVSRDDPVLLVLRQALQPLHPRHGRGMPRHERPVAAEHHAVGAHLVEQEAQGLLTADHRVVVQAALVGARRLLDDAQGIGGALPAAVQAP